MGIFQVFMSQQQGNKPIALKSDEIETPSNTTLVEEKPGCRNVSYFLNNNNTGQ